VAIPLENEAALPAAMDWTIMTNTHWPTEIRVAKDRASLKITFEDGADFDLPSEYLRVMSPSAEVRGHGPSERKTVSGKRHVQIVAVEPVGNYAVRIVFDDMHSTGLFGWDYLRDLGAKKGETWAGYLAELDAKGLSRDPAGRA
jgi:DUF971 family protein